MSENKQGNKLSMADMISFKELFETHGYAIVNDFEMADDELGFDITGNETLQKPQVSNKLFTYEDMSEIESYLNGSGYSIVDNVRSSTSTEVVANTVFDNYMGHMAFFRTCSSALALVLSTVIMFKVW
tara:strand:+ start:269 stop:652 length:384 start_codon:yes stop_codon:yes gene_type:complete